MNAEQKNKLIKALYRLTNAGTLGFCTDLAVSDLNEAIILIMEIKHELANMV